MSRGGFHAELPAKEELAPTARSLLGLSFHRIIESYELEGTSEGHQSNSPAMNGDKSFLVSFLD